MAGSDIMADVPKRAEADAYSLATPLNNHEGDQREAINETTTLLSGDSPISPAEPSGTDGWDGYKEYEHLPWYKRPSVYWLLPPYALFTLAFGCSIVPKLNLIIALICKRYFAEKSILDDKFVVTPIVLGGDNPQCNIPEVQANVATFGLMLSVITGVLSAYTAPKIGSLSDRYGRKKLLALASLGGVMGELVTIFAAKFPDVVHYKWLLLAVVFDGLAGSFTAGSVLAHSYTSDCTPPSRRGVAIGYLHSCLFSGMAFGPLIGGYFVKWTGSLLSLFYITTGCHIIFILCIAFVIPESVSKRRQLLAREKHRLEVEKRDERARQWLSAYTAKSDRRASFFCASPQLLASLRTANPFEPLKVLFPKGIENKRVRRNLILLAISDMTVLGAAMSSGQVTLLYSELQFGWGNFETSRFISLVSLVRVIVLVGIFPVINYFCRIRPAQRRRRESGAVTESNAGADEMDVWVLRFAVLSDLIGMGGYIFARSEAAFVTCGVITAFGGMASATIQSMLSKHVPSDMVGSLLGAIGLLHALSRIIGPVIFNGIYAATVKSFPQAVFVMITSLFGSVLVLALLVRPHIFMTEPEQPSEDTPVRPGAHRHDTNISEDEIVPQI